MLRIYIKLSWGRLASCCSVLDVIGVQVVVLDVVGVGDISSLCHIPSETAQEIQTTVAIATSWKARSQTAN